MSYQLFYAPGTASMAVHWMPIELGVAFRAECVDLEAGEQRSAAYLQLNPAGRVPTLIVGGQAHTESAALLMLLAERHPEARLAPVIGDAQRGKWLETMVYLTNTVSSAMRDWFYADKDGAQSCADAVRQLARARIDGAWDHVNALLGDGRPYLLGREMTTADFLATMLMRWTRNMPRSATSWDRVGAYVARIRARPGFLEVCRREELTD